MKCLPPTFETLAASRNEAAIDVLIAALGVADADVHRHAIEAIVRRGEVRARRTLLASWSMLTPDGVETLKSHKNWISDTVVASLKSGEESLELSIDAARSLELLAAIDVLVELAESHATRSIRVRAASAVLDLVTPLGRDAREDRSPATIRGPVLARLADSVNRFSLHRNERLVEAFLLTSNWGDHAIRQMILEDGESMELICEQLAKTEHPGVIDFLAGFIRRKNLSPRIMALMQTRADAAFRDALLRFVGSEPSGSVCRNLRDMGMPKSCHGGEELVSQVVQASRAALIHLFVAANENHLETMHLITSVVRHGGPGCNAAAAIGLMHCDVPAGDFWMRAAVPIADDDQAAINADENAKLLSDLIELLGHDEPALVRGVQRVLQPLHAEAMLHKLHSLRPRSRRRLGRVVMMIDPGAVQRVRDALRHPVLAQRLEAIAMADALAIVDLLADSFTHISREDHQEARMKAAQVMADADSDETLKLLQDMVDMPESPVRDAAVVALDRRTSTQKR